MKEETEMRRRVVTVLAALLLMLGLCLVASAQSGEAQNPVQLGPAQTGQANQVLNLQKELDLTPEQIQKWRAINAELKDEWQAANQRLWKAQRALAEAIESPTPNEELIKQRARDVSDAQAAKTQLQALRQARTLQILSPEQRVKLREIEKQQALIRRQQAIQRNGNQQQLPANGLGQRRDGLQRRPNAAPPSGKPNAAPPLGPRQRKLLRQPPRR